MNAGLQDHLLTVINFAITNHRVVQFKHNKIWRTVEPYLVGIGKNTQAMAFYGFCRDVVPSIDAADNKLWQVFTITDIRNIELTFYEFSPHPDYMGRQEHIYPVYKKVEPQDDYMEVDAFSISY